MGCELNLSAVKGGRISAYSVLLKMLCQNP